MSNYAEVAKLAGVSPTTVARIVNNRPGVRPEKIALVRKAMEDLGYAPPPPAVRRGPKTAAREGVHTKRIAYLLIQMNDSAIGGITYPGAMSRALLQHGINLLYVPTENKSRLPDIINPYQIDGIIYQGEEPEGEALETMKRIPTVRLMTRKNGTAVFDCIAPDNVALGEMAVEYFASRNISKVAVLCTNYEYCAFKKRIDAFRIQCESMNVEIIHDVSVTVDDELRFKYAENFLNDALEKAAGERLGIFVTEVENILAVCRSYWRLSLPLQKKVDLLLGDPLSFIKEQSLRDTLSFFDIRQDELNMRAVDQLLWRMRNPGVNASAVDVSLRPILRLRRE